MKQKSESANKTMHKTKPARCSFGIIARHNSSGALRCLLPHMARVLLVIVGVPETRKRPGNRASLLAALVRSRTSECCRRGCAKGQALVTTSQQTRAIVNLAVFCELALDCLAKFN